MQRLVKSAAQMEKAMDEATEAALMRAGHQINALATNERRLIDELAALRTTLAAVTAEASENKHRARSFQRNAERYRWLAARLLAADFDYNGEGVQALVFELPAGCAVSADCDATIDDAMAAAPAVGAA